MIDFKRGRIVRSDLADSEVITRWSVVFKTPFGLCMTLEEVQKTFQERDLDPDLIVIPLPCAHSATTYEVFDRVERST